MRARRDGEDGLRTRRRARLRLPSPLGRAAPAGLCSCGRLDELLYSPPTTPEQWCEQRPCIAVGDRILNEPLGSGLVFLLAALWIGAGLRFWWTRSAQRSRGWLALALLLGGIGALQAGISYQAFSYELKCAGRATCLLTNGFEVGYGITQAASVSAMLVAVAYACTRRRLRSALIGYSAANALLYLLVASAGVLIPSRTLLSFEVLLLFALPGIGLVVAVAGGRYAQGRQPLDRSLLIASLLLVAVQAAYFAYLAGGITQRLWKRGAGCYFSENDVLHVGMILWVCYVVFAVGAHLRDASEPSDARAAALRRARDLGA